MFKRNMSDQMAQDFQFMPIDYFKKIMKWTKQYVLLPVVILLLGGIAWYYEKSEWYLPIFMLTGMFVHLNFWMHGDEQSNPGGLGPGQDGNLVNDYFQYKNTMQPYGATSVSRKAKTSVTVSKKTTPRWPVPSRERPTDNKKTSKAPKKKKEDDDEACAIMPKAEVPCKTKANDLTPQNACALAATEAAKVRKDITNAIVMPINKVGRALQGEFSSLFNLAVNGGAAVEQVAKDAAKDVVITGKNAAAIAKDTFASVLYFGSAVKAAVLMGKAPSSDAGIQDRLLIGWLIYTRMHMSIVFVMVYTLLAINLISQIPVLSNFIRIGYVFGFLEECLPVYSIVFLAGLMLTPMVLYTLDDGGVGVQGGNCTYIVSSIIFTMVLWILLQ